MRRGVVVVRMEVVGEVDYDHHRLTSQGSSRDGGKRAYIYVVVTVDMLSSLGLFATQIRLD